MKKKKLIWAVVFLVAAIVCIVATVFIALYFISDNNNQQYLNKTENISTIANKVEDHDINWNKLQKTNSDIYAWIYVPNTKVDYAIVQPTGDEDDFFYLDRNLNKNYEFAGSIYSEKQNSKEFSDPVTLLYGHNMLNGSMFATLHKFESSKFFKKNKYMYVYTPTNRLTYKIYAAYVYDDRHILNSFDFKRKKIIKKYFKYTQNPNSTNKNTRKLSLNVNSKILTLSTCTSGASNTRYLIQGVLIKNEQTY